ncbi:MAG TPA: carbohydrate ABC transporter permease [bacterium]|nr:carbohydrate ABC transporter permease [bacterium]HPR87547.1 carbohydrate ABC transporter permease [bacterium]
MKRALTWLILILGAVVFLYPFLWMVAATLKPEMEIPSFGLLPSRVSLASYEQVFAKIPLLRALINSLVVSFSITASVLFFGSMVGYALSRLRFRGRELMVMAILFTMMIPFQLTMIPLYILMVKLHWTDTYLALIVPGMMSGFGILLFRQFFQSVPQSLIDAARVDGLSDMQILFRIIWPLSRPILITVGIITFMNTWNDVLWPLIVIRDQSIMTMPQMVTIFAVSGMAEAQLGVKLAAATLLALPVIIAYAFFQRYFIESLASTGLKG